MRIQGEIESGHIWEFSVDASEVLKFRVRLYVQVDSEIREEILKEAYNSPYIIHLGGTKI